jgi:hypothetical protein
VQGAVGFLKEKGDAVRQSETYQKGVEKAGTVVETVKTKAGEIAASERVQAGKTLVTDTARKGVEKVKDTAQTVREHETVQKGLEAAEKARVTAVEKTAVAAAAAVGGTISAASVAKQVWSNGKGEMQRAKAAIKAGDWSGSARSTLDMKEREEEWANFKVRGCEEVTVAAWKEYTTSYFVKSGMTIMWTFRVQKLDIQFCLRSRVMADGGAVELELMSTEKCDDTETVTGSWTAPEDTNVIIVFDNTYSMMRPKTIAYVVGVSDPAAVAETVAETAGAAEPEAKAEATPEAEAKATPEAEATANDEGAKPII